MRYLLTLALVLTLAMTASAGPFGIFGRGGCAGGNCSGGSCASGNCGSAGYSYTRQYAAPASTRAIDCCFMDEPAAIEPRDGLIAAGRVFPGALVCESTQQAYLMTLAQNHADTMARMQQGGHQNWGTRFTYIQQAGLGTGNEICAESWDWEETYSYEEIGKSMFKSWRSSPGHWAYASTRHRYYGAGMAKGRNGIWYACLIVSD